MSEKLNLPLGLCSSDTFFGSTKRDHERAALDQVSLQFEILKRADRIRLHIDARLPAKGRSVVAVEDVFQDVCTAAFQQAKTFDIDALDSVEAWIMTLANRSIVDSIRRCRSLRKGGEAALVQRNRDAASYLDLFCHVTSRRETPSSEVAMREAVASVQVCIGKLPDDQRQAIVLRHIDRRTWDEIAAEMDKTVPAVRGLLNRAMAHMRTDIGRASRFFSDASGSSDDLTPFGAPS